MSYTKQQAIQETVPYNEIEEAYKPSSECVICGCIPKPDEWSTQAENCCFDCA